MKKRCDVDQNDSWRLESLYPNLEEWDLAFSVFSVNTSDTWTKLENLKSAFLKDSDQLLPLLDFMMEIEKELSKLYTYAHLKHDEELTNPTYKIAYEKILAVCHKFSQETAWLQPAILSLSESLLAEILSASKIKEYHFYLEKIIRLKAHTLSAEGEHLCALASQSLETASKAFNAINDADFKFGFVLNGSNEPYPLSHGTYGLYLRDLDRTLRKNAFEKYHQHYANYENTLTELITGQIQSHYFHARSHYYPSCLDAALFPKNIDTAVYHSLIEAVTDNLPVLHRYIALRKNILKVDELHSYDLYVPLVETAQLNIPYKQAEELVIDSVAPLGKDYQNILREGLQVQGWVDKYENENKRSGAYSSGCYGSFPYILMNYKGVLRDVFTLAHEAGHSMHSYYSRKFQPYQYSDYSIFLAEVASTFNENLLTRHLLNQPLERKDKIFLINQQIEDIRSTLFRQTMFAEFELMIHSKVEKGYPLTPQFLKEEYKHLNQKYFGPTLSLEKEIEIEWARIPHFYYNFYVFQYATGISAALTLSEAVAQGNQTDLDRYLSFLKGGSSNYPIEMLKIAGVDMRSKIPVTTAIKKFEGLVNQLQALIG